MFRGRILNASNFLESFQYLGEPTYDHVLLHLEPINPKVANAADDGSALDRHKVILGVARIDDRIADNLRAIRREGRIPIEKAHNLTELKNGLKGAKRDQLSANGGILVGPNHVAFSIHAAKAVGFDPEQIWLLHAKRYPIVPEPFEQFNNAYDRRLVNGALVESQRVHILTWEEAMDNAPKTGDKPDLSRLFDAESNPPVKNTTLEGEGMDLLETAHEIRTMVLNILTQAEAKGLSVADVIREVQKRGPKPKGPKPGGPSEP